MVALRGMIYLCASRSVGVVLTKQHLQGRIPEVTLRCIQHLRRNFAGCRVSVEVEKPSREGLRELAAEADVVFYSRSWAEVRTTFS